jgi:hypothetical protein
MENREKTVVFYEVRFQPWNGSWLLSAPVGANGLLLFTSARDAASHARWDAKVKGGIIKVYDMAGKLCNTTEIEAEVSDGKVDLLPSV